MSFYFYQIYKVLGKEGRKLKEGLMKSRMMVSYIFLYVILFLTNIKIMI